MTTVDDIDSYYIEHYERMVAYVMNKGRIGDRLAVYDEDDARGIVHLLYIYYRMNVDMFYPMFINYTLRMKRKGWFRDRFNYFSLKSSYRMLLETEGVPSDEDSVSINGLIDSIKDDTRRDVITRYLDGDAIPDVNERNVVYRFKKRMGELYERGIRW